MFGIDEGKIEIPYLLSGASLASSMFLFGKLSGGKLVPCDTLGELAYGVIYDNPSAADRPARCRVAGIAEVTAGEALTVDRYVTPGADGKAYHCRGTQIPRAKVLVAAGAGERALVLLSAAASGAGSLVLLTSTFDLADIANGAMLTGYPAPFDGRIEAIRARVLKAASTAAKLATLTPTIATVATTGGVLNLTSANMTPIGAVVAGSTITAARDFAAGDALGITASAVTAFIEGRAAIDIVLSKRG